MKFLGYLWVILCLSACSKSVELKTKLEISSYSPDWAKLYTEINDLNSKIKETESKINQSKREISSKIEQIEDSLQAVKVEFYKKKYFSRLAGFNKIFKKSQELNAHYRNARTKFNYWLTTVQNDVISEDTARVQFKLFQDKYDSIRKELTTLRVEYSHFATKSNQAADELSEVLPEIVGIRLKE